MNYIKILDLATCQVMWGARVIQAFAQKGLDNIDLAQITKPDDTIQTVVDREAAKEMLRLITGKIADEVYVIDEEFPPIGNRDAEWVCYQDSADGTGNLVFQPERVLPVSGVVWVKNGISEVCAAADPMLDRMIYAVREKGAYVSDYLAAASVQRLKILEPDPKNNRKVVMFDSMLNPQTHEAAGKMLEACGSHTRKFATYSSCLLHLWMLAIGKAQVVVIDAMGGFWDAGLHLACQEVGCKVTDIHGNDIAGPTKLENGVHPFILGTAPGVDHAKLLDAAQSAFGKDYAGYTGKQK